MVNNDRMVNQLQEFIRISSPSLHEKQFAAKVKEVLASLGIKCQEDNAGRIIGGDCGNLFAKIPGDKKKPTLLFSAHLDTVETGSGIKPVLKKGVLTAAGDTILGADDKTGVVAILEMLRVLKEKKLPHGPIELVFSVAEEMGLLGAKQFDCKKLKAKAGFILDASGPVGGIVVRAPAYDAIDVIITGRAAHAGASPEDGVSAIQIASQAIARMQLGRINNKTTANIGLISGGVARNVVPEHCHLKGEARSHSPAALARQTQHMLNCLHGAAKRAGGGIEIEVERQFEAFHATTSSLPVKLAKSAAKQLKLAFSMKSSGGGADTAVFAAAGIPSVSVCGGYENPHSVKECLPIEQLRLLAEYTLAIVANL